MNRWVETRGAKPSPTELLPLHARGGKEERNRQLTSKGGGGGGTVVHWLVLGRGPRTSRSASFLSASPVLGSLGPSLLSGGIRVCLDASGTYGETGRSLAAVLSSPRLDLSEIKTLTRSQLGTGSGVAAVSSGIRGREDLTPRDGGGHDTGQDTGRGLGDGGDSTGRDANSSPSSPLLSAGGTGAANRLIDFEALLGGGVSHRGGGELDLSTRGVQAGGEKDSSGRGGRDARRVMRGPHALGDATDSGGPSVETSGPGETLTGRFGPRGGGGVPRGRDGRKGQARTRRGKGAEGRGRDFPGEAAGRRVGSRGRESENTRGPGGVKYCYSGLAEWLRISESGFESRGRKGREKKIPGGRGERGKGVMNGEVELWVCECCGMLVDGREGENPGEVPCPRCGRPLGVIS